MGNLLSDPTLMEVPEVEEEKVANSANTADAKIDYSINTLKCPTLNAKCSTPAPATTVAAANLQPASETGLEEKKSNAVGSASSATNPDQDKKAASQKAQKAAQTSESKQEEQRVNWLTMDVDKLSKKLEKGQVTIEGDRVVLQGTQPQALDDHQLVRQVAANMSIAGQENDARKAEGKKNYLADKASDLFPGIVSENKNDSKSSSTASIFSEVEGPFGSSSPISLANQYERENQPSSDRKYLYGEAFDSTLDGIDNNVDRYLSPSESLSYNSFDDYYDYDDFFSSFGDGYDDDYGSFGNDYDDYYYGLNYYCSLILQSEEPSEADPSEHRRNLALGGSWETYSGQPLKESEAIVIEARKKEAATLAGSSPLDRVEARLFTNPTVASHINLDDEDRNVA